MYVCICNKDMQYRYVIQIFNTDITNDMQYRYAVKAIGGT